MSITVTITAAYDQGYIVQECLPGRFQKFYIRTSEFDENDIKPLELFLKKESFQILPSEDFYLGYKIANLPKS
jgi:hypothetical protein